MEVHLKVQKARMDAGMNQTAFAQKLGLSQNDVWRMENGEKKFVSRAYIDFMLEQGYDLNSLFDVNLDLQKRNYEHSLEPQGNNFAKTSEIGKENYIPLFPYNVSNDFTNFLNHIKDFIPEDYLYLPYMPKNDGAIRIFCDSMYPILKPRDIVIFKRHPCNFEDIFYGEIYLISLKFGDQEIVTFKRLQRADCDGECVKLVSENPRFQSKDIPIEKIKAMALIKTSIVNNSGMCWKHN